MNNKTGGNNEASYRISKVGWLENEDQNKQVFKVNVT